MIPGYTSEVQEQLITALQKHQLIRLDFSQYDPDPPRYFGAAANIHSAALLSNDQMLVSSQYDNYIRVYNYQSGSGGGALRNLTGRAFCCAGLPNGHVICGNGNNLQVWDITKDQCLKTLTGDTGYVTSLAVLPNGQVVSYSKKDTLGRDGSCLYSRYYLAVWDVDTGQKILMSDIGGSGSESCLLAVLPNGQVVTTHYSNLYVWERSVDKFLCLKQLQHSGGIKSIAVLSNGQVVTAGNHRLLQLWDVSTGQCLQTLAGHTDHVLCLAVLPNGQLVSGSRDNTVRIWDVSTGQCLKTVSRSVNHLWALPNGQVLSDDSSHRYNSNQFIRWTPFPRYCYGRIAPVLQAITPECGLQELSLGGVDLGQVGYAYLQELVQNVPSLQKLDLSDTDLTSGQIETLNQALQYHQAQHRLLQAQAKRIRQLEMQLSTTLAGEPYLKAQAQTKRDEQLQEQARQIRHLEIQLRRALQQANLETYLPSLTYSKVTFNCPVIEQTYHPIEDEAIPDEFLCPITRQIMWEPVMADDGYTYERDVIEAHFQRSVTSPMLPEEPLASQRLVMNRNVRAAIQRLLERHPEWVLHQPDAVYFSFAYEVTVQAAIVANDRAALLRAIDQEPRLLTRSLTQGMLIEQVWHQTELLEAVVQRLTPAMWSHMIQKEGSVSNWLAKLAKSALASQLQQFTVFLSALQAGLSCEYPTEALIAQGLHQSLPVLLLLGLDRLSGVNSSLDEQQNTALHYAAASGNLLLVTTLVEHGATIILKNKVGQTPKALAQLGGHDKVVAFCQQAKLQPFISQLLGNLGFLSQYQALREKVDQQQATMLHLEAQIQAQDQELQRLRGARSPSLCAVTPTGD